MAQNKKKSSDGASSGFDAGAILRKKPWITALVTVFVLGGIILLYIFLPAGFYTTSKDCCGN